MNLEKILYVLNQAVGKTVMHTVVDNDNNPKLQLGFSIGYQQALHDVAELADLDITFYKTVQERINE